MMMMTMMMMICLGKECHEDCIAHRTRSSPYDYYDDDNHNDDDDDHNDYDLGFMTIMMMMMMTNLPACLSKGEAGGAFNAVTR